MRIETPSWRAALGWIWGRGPSSRRPWTLAAIWFALFAAQARAQLPNERYPAVENQDLPGMPASQPTAMPAYPQGLVEDVEIVGNTSVSANRIVREMRTRKDRIFDPQQFTADVRRLLRTGLFLTVDPSTRQTPTGVIVTIQVVEKPTVRYITYHGNRSHKDKTLSKETGLKVGEPFNNFNIEDGRRRLEEFYHRKGFPKASVTIVEGTRPGDKGVVYQINEGFRVKIRETTFVGNDPQLVTDARLKTIINPGLGWFKRIIRDNLDRAKVDEDVQLLTGYYRSLGYFRARVGCEAKIDESGNWADLNFVIDEGPRYVVRNATVGGNQRFTSEDLQSQLELKPGEYFNLAKMNRDLNTLRDLYGSQGFVFADIKATQRFREEDAELNLTYNIAEGDQFRVGKINIHIAGEFPHTRQSTILNRLSMNPGDIIDVREIRASERRLIASQLFEADAAQGKKPEIRIRPPELNEDEELARDPNSRVRAQSPDGAPRVRYVPLDVFLPPWKK